MRQAKVPTQLSRFLKSKSFFYYGNMSGLVGYGSSDEEEEISKLTEKVFPRHLTMIIRVANVPGTSPRDLNLILILQRSLKQNVRGFI